MISPYYLPAGQWVDWNQNGRGPTIRFYADGSMEWISIVKDDGGIILPSLTKPK